MFFVVMVMNVGGRWEGGEGGIMKPGGSRIPARVTVQLTFVILCVVHDIEVAHFILTVWTAEERRRRGKRKGRGRREGGRRRKERGREERRRKEGRRKKRGRRKERGRKERRKERRREERRRKERKKKEGRRKKKRMKGTLILTLQYYLFILGICNYMYVNDQ